ncbi:hypothetical protein CC86DRAFT_94970 [Ophiobolus disseminans]|uniref:RNA ligase domain-containing protein n=1 Tax=Ophiobolus disseminans TaxID=1469910 RepID=A0A6A6ZLW1_9PLEO|nr:hypothetical protein CC86DRAFT_94970 [Ophiobolus disseminans]
MSVMESSNSQTLTSQPAMANSAASTLYPKITTHINEVVAILRKANCDAGNPEKNVILDPIPIVGTVKLHGTHADMLIYSDNRIVFQSRGVVGLQPTKDNAGFAAAMSPKTKALLRLRDLFTACYTQLDPDTPIDPTHPVLIAGEWIGEKIQKDVAITHLSKRFVIISININGQWQKDSDYSAIALPNHAIYNISRAGVFNHILYPENIQHTANELEALAEEVAKHCPFAATFNLAGEGEGIVWKPAFAPHNANPALWFKTKGGRFKPTFAPAPRQSSEHAQQMRKAAAAVARIWTSQQRLEQGLEYLTERHVQRNLQGLGAFLKWVQNDVLVEEKGCINEHGVDVQTLKIEIAKIAKTWYLERMEG